MSIIINPNEPQTRKATPLDQIVNTMRVIAQYRLSFFDLEAAKQDNGAQEPLTAREIEAISEEQQRLMQNMVAFILYGENQHGKSISTNRETPTANIEDDAQKLTQTAP